MMIIGASDKISVSFDMRKTKCKSFFNIINESGTQNHKTFLNQRQKPIMLYNIIANLHMSNVIANLFGFHALTIDKSKSSNLLQSPPVTLQVKQVSESDGL